MQRLIARAKDKVVELEKDIMLLVLLINNIDYLQRLGPKKIYQLQIIM